MHFGESAHSAETLLSCELLFSWLVHVSQKAASSQTTNELLQQNLSGTHQREQLLGLVEHLCPMTAISRSCSGQSQCN